VENSVQIELSDFQKLVIGCAFSLFSFFAFAFAFNNWRITYSALNNSEVIEGSVMGNSNRPQAVGDHGVAPILWFRTPDGKEWTVQSKNFTNFPTWQPGDLVSIRYHRDDPSQAEIYSFFQFWLYPLVSTLCGILFGVTAVLFLRDIRSDESVTS
jgi:hypothetical protein